MSKPAIFLDRDGTINEQMGYINHMSRFKVLEGVPEAIKLINENEFLAIILSNQSGVARGYFPIEFIDEVHNYLRELLKKEQAFIDGIFFCPHYPRGEVLEYCFECNCRKPKTGLISKACDQFDIDMSRSYMIGDRYTDMEFARRSGLRGVMVKTGYGLGDVKYILPNKDVKPVYIAEDLLGAVKWIIDNERS